MSRVFSSAPAAAALIVSVLGAPHGLALEAPPECGTIYTVAPGDTLDALATRVYGKGYLSQLILAANDDFIHDARKIEVGDRLLIPCRDGSVPRTRVEALEIERMVEPARVPQIAPLGAPRVRSLDASEVADAVSPWAVPRVVAALEPMGALPVQPSIAFPVLPEGTVLAALAAGQRFAQYAAPELAVNDEWVVETEFAPQIAPAVLSGFEPSPLSPLALLAEPRGEDTGALLVPSALDAAAPVPVAPRPLRLLTGSGVAPFAESGVDASGTAADLVRRSIDLGPGERDVHVTVINDWAAHLDVLLPGGMFDVSFPWFKPDCGRPERLDGPMHKLCAEFDFSRPFLEVAVGYYVRVGDQLAGIASLDGLRGTRLCRPEGSFMFDLAQSATETLGILTETATTAADCFVRLARSEVDVVSIVGDQATAALQQLGMAGTVAEIAPLRSTHTLHAVAPKARPDGKADLAEIDQGLERLMLSGGWFEIVAAHRSQVAKLTN